MKNALPSGARDVLPEEMRELRTLTDAMRAVFDEAGYGEIHTPALEYESVLRRGRSDRRPTRPDRAAPAPA